MTNNIQVTLLAFVGGISFGLTVWALVTRLILGVIAGWRSARATGSRSCG
jgi:uncharacterized membrane protein SpoIIM required for sporulation